MDDPDGLGVAYIKKLRSLLAPNFILSTKLLTCPYETWPLQYNYQFLSGAGYKPSLQPS